MVLVVSAGLVAVCEHIATAEHPAASGFTMLHNGVLFPTLGFGTASGVREEHVSAALRFGARLIDTAQASAPLPSTTHVVGHNS